MGLWEVENVRAIIAMDVCAEIGRVAAGAGSENPSSSTVLSAEESVGTRSRFIGSEYSRFTNSVRRGRISREVHQADAPSSTSRPFNGTARQNRAAQEIALPITRYGAVRNFSGPFPDGDGFGDLTARVSMGLAISARTNHVPLVQIH